ncbi:CesT family type III secretion system chaperone [Algicola sagamiensis]|uniref:CesT family type III secretion system chaperone n=1 Tax=Algicola sagamiensis TaxID=163869 RepID=UPI00036ABBBE|nr:CesT family type III secretion system chaperone [Algicola sagamiensis]
MSYADHQLQHWLTEFGQSFGTNFQLDDEGRCSLQANDDVILNLAIRNGDEGFTVNAVLYEVPTQHKVTTFEKALSLNLFQAETRGAAIAYDEQANSLMLNFTGEFARLNYQDFTNILNNLVDTTAKLRQNLEANTDKGDYAAHADPNEMIGMLRI